MTKKMDAGRTNVPLSHYWYDLDEFSLKKYKDKVAFQSSEYKAVIDANVFIEMFENNQHILNANLLLEDVTFFITPELRNEIQRDENTHRRIEMLEYANEFLELIRLQINRDKENELKKILGTFLPSTQKQQDNSDLTQLSQAISLNADFFITNDQKIIKKVTQNCPMMHLVY